MNGTWRKCFGKIFSWKNPDTPFGQLLRTELHLHKMWKDNCVILNPEGQQFNSFFTISFPIMTERIVERNYLLQTF